MAQQYLGGGDDGAVYPLLRTHTTGSQHHRTQVAAGDAELLGIEGKLMLLAAMEIDKAQETIEYLIGMGRRRHGCAVMKELVIIMSNRGYQAVDDLLIGAVLSHQVVQKTKHSVENGSLLKGYNSSPILHLSIEEFRQSTSMRHQEEVGWQAHSLQQEIIAHLQGLHDGAWRDEDDSAFL